MRLVVEEFAANDEALPFYRSEKYVYYYRRNQENTANCIHLQFPIMHTEIPKFDICSLSEYGRDDILISRFSPYLKQHLNLAAPHRHSFYHMVFFTEGAGKHTIDFQQFIVKPFQIYFMVPGQVHSWNFEGKVDGYVVNFSAEFFQSFLLRSDYVDSFSFFAGRPQSSVIDCSDKKEQMVSIFESLLIHAQSGSVLDKDMIRLLLLQIFIHAEQGNYDKHESSSLFHKNPVIRNFQALIDRHYLKLRLPGEYAELLNITPNHLNALCNEHLGMQAGKLIRERVLLEAKRLLVNMDLSVSEIAYKLNFSDNSYFTKFFKKEVGMTPEVFRQTLRSEGPL